MKGYSITPQFEHCLTITQTYLINLICIIIQVDKDSHDWYCFQCHSAGDVISCTSCYRVYHLSCIEKEDLPENDVKHKFVCNICKVSNFLVPYLFCIEI